jgi:hypothetical protein
VIIGINLLKTGTKKVCSVFLAAFMVLPVGFEKANALGIRETVETPDGIVQRIRFTKDEFPAVLDFFRAEKDRLEGFGPVMWALASPPLIGSVYFLPAFALIFSVLERLFTGGSDVTGFIFKEANKSGIVFDTCAIVAFFLLFVHDGIPRAERISERWDYRDVRRVIECLEELPRIEKQEHYIVRGDIVEEFYIDETPQGKIKAGFKNQNGNFGYLGNDYENLRGLFYNKFWKKI